MIWRVGNTANRASLVSFLPFQLTISRQADHRDRFLQQPRFLPRRGPLNFRSIGCDIFSSVSWKKASKRIEKNPKMINLFLHFQSAVYFPNGGISTSRFVIIGRPFILCFHHMWGQKANSTILQLYWRSRRGPGSI